MLVPLLIISGAIKSLPSPTKSVLWLSEARRSLAGASTADGVAVFGGGCLGDGGWPT